MAEFENVFVVIDPTQQAQPALERAVKLLAGTKAHLHCFLCDYPSPEQLANSSSKHETKTRLHKQSLQRLHELTGELGEQSFEIGLDAYWNEDWPRSVVFASTRKHSDLIVKAMSPSRDKTIRFKSSDRYLLRNANCPVLLARPESDGVYKRVVAAIDLESGDEAHIRLNNAVIRNAKALAQDTDARLVLVSAHKQALNQHLLEASDEELGLEERVARTFDVDVNQVLLQTGSARKVILHNTGRNGDVLVMGTRARKGLSGALFGNTVEKVLHDIHCDVLAVN